MSKRKTMAAVALAAALVVPTGGAAQARHVCNIEDPTLDQACESHPEDSSLFRKIFCLISPSC